MKTSRGNVHKDVWKLNSICLDLYPYHTKLRTDLAARFGSWEEHARWLVLIGLGNASSSG